MRELVFNSITRLDLVVWVLVLMFFCGSSLLFGGDIQLSFLGASGIIVEMLIIGLSIEIIIESIKHIKGIGTVTGFITNGPEALCLIVGLVAGDVLFAASTPLGSNFMNPVLLIVAALICGKMILTFKTRPVYTATTLLSTATLAISFYLIGQPHYTYWLVAAILVTIPLFLLRPNESGEESDDMYDARARRWFFPAIILLLASGYFLDSVVTFAADNSKAPKGVIGFLVLATLTSWPEFKSCLALLSRNKPLAAILNITISNITNIWLALTGVAYYLFFN